MGGSGSGRTPLIPEGHRPNRHTTDNIERTGMSRPNALPAEKDGRPIWERWQGEPPQAFAAFVAYRDQSPLVRSLASTMEIITAAREEAREARLAEGKRVRKAPKKRATSGAITGWSVEFSWYDRADHHDRFLDSKRTAAQVDAVRDMATRHVSIGGLLQNKAIKRIKEMAEDALTPKLALEYLAEGIKIERLGRGQETSRTSVSTQAPIAADPPTPLTQGDNDITPEQARTELLSRLDTMSKRREMSVDTTRKLAIVPDDVEVKAG